MRLFVYSSKSRGDQPNLVAVQDERMSGLPTVLVCPMQRTFKAAPFRASAVWRDGNYVVACELLRPIHRRALRQLGELGEEDSRRIVATVKALLADEP